MLWGTATARRSWNSSSLLPFLTRNSPTVTSRKHSLTHTPHTQAVCWPLPACRSYKQPRTRDGPIAKDCSSAKIASMHGSVMRPGIDDCVTSQPVTDCSCMTDVAFFPRKQRRAGLCLGTRLCVLAKTTPKCHMIGSLASFNGVCL